jgi:hypothetical protein
MIPAVDIAYIADELDQFADELAAADEDSGAALREDPASLIDALRQLLDELRRRAFGPQTDALTETATLSAGRDFSALGNHGLDLIAQLAALAGRLGRRNIVQRIEGLALPLACWSARQGAEISSLGPVVNGAAALANRLREPTSLAQLYVLLREICGAVSPQVSQPALFPDPTRPWRVLLFNQAIVATRSHQPGLMEEAFELLTEHLPDDAPEFFREGMEQMDALDYPTQTRAVMERYYSKWCKGRTLH